MKHECSVMFFHQLVFERNCFHAYCFKPVLQCKLLSLFILGKTFSYLKQKQKNTRYEFSIQSY